MAKGINKIIEDEEYVKNLIESSKNNNWLEENLPKIKSVFKDADEVTWIQYCLHTRDLVQLSTNPRKNCCDRCINERLNNPRKNYEQ